MVLQNLVQILESSYVFYLGEQIYLPGILKCGPRTLGIQLLITMPSCATGSQQVEFMPCLIDCYLIYFHLTLGFFAGPSSGSNSVAPDQALNYGRCLLDRLA